MIKKNPTTTLNRYFIKHDIKMENEHMKLFNNIIHWKMQIITMMKYYTTYIRMYKVQHANNKKCG